jgi:hypothetical protein
MSCWSLSFKGRAQKSSCFLFLLTLTTSFIYRPVSASSRLELKMVTLQETRIVPVGIILTFKAIAKLKCGGITARGLPNLLDALREDKGKMRERGVLTSQSVLVSSRLCGSPKVADEALVGLLLRLQSRIISRCASFTRLATERVVC